jgi:NADH-quinone oxidoreductase subunit E
MARLSNDNVELAREIIGHYPRPKSALIPLLHLAQEQDGHLTDDAMAHIGQLVGVSSAEVLGTASFYEMFKMETVGRYMVNICTNISCQLRGGEELLAHAEKTLGIRPGQTTSDGLFTLEDVECIAACTEAPCLQVNYRYEHRISNEGFALVAVPTFLPTECLLKFVSTFPTTDALALLLPKTKPYRSGSQQRGRATSDYRRSSHHHFTFR